MFADDIALITDSEDKLQQMLNKVYSWCNRWRLTLNLDKTKIVHYRHPSQSRSSRVFMYGQGEIGICDKYKYLGLWMHELMDYGETVRPLSSSANRALGALITKVKNIGGMSYDMFTRLYESLVLPVLNYGAAIWGTAKYHCANVIQNRASRYFLGVGRNTSNDATRAEMGWKPQLHRQYIEILRLHCRLQTLPSNRLTADIHKFCLNSGNTSLWENRVQKLFAKLNIDLPRNEFTVKNVIRNFSNTLQVIDQETWYHDIWQDRGCPNGNKLRTFRLYKTRMVVEPFIQNLPRYARSTLSRLRCGSLPLNIETGRFKNVNLEDRICSLCNSNVIEDEMHFTIDCSFYDDIRFKMLQSFDT